MKELRFIILILLVFCLMAYTATATTRSSASLQLKGVVPPRVSVEIDTGSGSIQSASMYIKESNNIKSGFKLTLEKREKSSQSLTIVSRDNDSALNQLIQDRKIHQGESSETPAQSGINQVTLFSDYSGCRLNDQKINLFSNLGKIDDDKLYILHIVAF